MNKVNPVRELIRGIISCVRPVRDFISNGVRRIWYNPAACRGVFSNGINSRQDVKNHFIALYLFGVTFIVYCMTLCPSVYNGDSGELISAAFSLGIAHPPGYPLYCLLGKAFSFLPVSNIAFRINLMSAFFASASAACFFYLIIFHEHAEKKTQMLNFRLAAISAVLIFAFSSELWAQAVIAEVYTLNLFLVILLFLFLFDYFCSKRLSCLYGFAFLAGLAPANHQMVLIFYPLFAVWFLLGDILIFRKSRVILKCVLLFLLSICLYLYLPIRSFFNPPIDWGNPQTCHEFFNHVLRRQYGSLITRYPHTLSRFISHLNIYAIYLKEQFNYFFLFLSLTGIFYLYKKDKKLLLITLAAFLISSWGSLWVLNFPLTIGFFYSQSVFFIQSYLFIALWMAFGIYFFLNLSQKVGGNFHRVILIFFSLLFLIPLYNNFYANNKKNYHLAYDYGRNLLKTLEKDAVLFAGGDNELSILCYLKIVEGLRPDVKIFDVMGGLVFENWGGDSYWEKEDKEKKKIFEDLKNKVILNPELKVYTTLDTEVLNIKGILFRPEGLLYRVVGSEEELYEGKNRWMDYLRRGIDDVSVYKDFLSREICATYDYFYAEFLYALGRKEQAWQAFFKAGEIAFHNERMQFDIGMAFYRKNMSADSLAQFKKTLVLNPRNTAALINLGTVYGNLGDYKKALVYWKSALKILPDNELILENLQKLKELEE